MDLVDVDSHTALHWAALGGNAEVCQILMENGISPNVQVWILILKSVTTVPCVSYTIALIITPYHQAILVC